MALIITTWQIVKQGVSDKRLYDLEMKLLQNEKLLNTNIKKQNSLLQPLKQAAATNVVKKDTKTVVEKKHFKKKLRSSN